MPYHCVAYGCGKTSEDGVTLFKFPKDPDEFRKWEKQVQRTRSWWTATPYSHLCSDHFGKEYFESKLVPTEALKLRPGAAPTVFVRPQCSCREAGCKRCLPAAQRQSLPAESSELSSSQEHKDTKWMSEETTPPSLTGDEERSAVCEMCGKTGSFSSFCSKSKRFCNISCSRSFSSHSKKTSILKRLKVWNK